MNSTHSSLLIINLKKEKVSISSAYLFMYIYTVDFDRSLLLIFLPSIYFLFFLLVFLYLVFISLFVLAVVFVPFIDNQIINDILFHSHLSRYFLFLYSLYSWYSNAFISAASILSFFLSVSMSQIHILFSFWPVHCKYWTFLI